MEPVTTLLISVGIFLGRLLSRNDVKSARNEALDARSRALSAKAEARTAFQEAASAARELDIHREISASWMARRLVHLFDHNGLNAARTTLGSYLEYFREIAGRMKRLPALPSDIFRRGVTVATSGAITIEVLQYLDQTGVIDAPIFHESLADVISDLPFDGAQDFASELGDVGDLAVADLIGDALLVFSVVRIFQNSQKADDLRSAASSYAETTSQFLSRTTKYREASEGFIRERTELTDEAYQLYRWILLTESAASTGKLRQPVTRKWLSGRLSEAVHYWWIKLSPSVPSQEA